MTVTGPLGAQVLEWSTPQIGRVVAGGMPLYYPSLTKAIEGRLCMVGNRFNVDVRNDYAFDIDETVQLEIEFYLGSESIRIDVSYDRNDCAYGFGGYIDPSLTKRAVLPPYTSERWYKTTFTLDRARFANRGFCQTDILICGESLQTPRPGETSEAFRPTEIAIANIVLRRSFTTAQPQSYGQLTIRVVSEDTKMTTARMGIYDATGRSVLPSDEAIAMRNFDESSREIALPGSVPWPFQNQSAFYANGLYHVRVPVGEYQLIATKGPEYRIERRHVAVTAGVECSIEVCMRRWRNMAQSGWYSGDGHVEYIREGTEDDHTLMRLADAEGLNVINVMRIGNSGNIYFPQSTWTIISKDSENPVALIPGQEDPRTGRRGHALALHLDGPIRTSSRYLLYHEIFERARARGALVGYAHLSDQDDMHHVRRGMALDVPFGLVDIVEIMQSGTANFSTWFDFLNLGYKLTPFAGSDYPYLGSLGSERSYVHLGHGFTAQDWLAGLKRGRTFVTNGPMLEFHVNSKHMGEELRAARGDTLFIRARADINPSIGELDRLELIEQGDVIRSIRHDESATEVVLQHDVRATHGTWFVLRAIGKADHSTARLVVAVSAPIYVLVDDGSFWKPSAVPTIISQLKQELQGVLGPPGTQFQVESWDTDVVDEAFWDSQRPLLEDRVAQATSLYDKLLESARFFNQDDKNFR